MTKEQLIQKINETYDAYLYGDERKVADVYFHDFIRFVNDELSQHLTKEGLKKLLEEYKSWLE
ncbi:MAG TPA: hypothetical protein VEY70_01500 [Metabacillus sp.]|nr:hypothetical protein [Metabacillus sp.]